MANFNMNTISGFSHLLGSSTKIPILIPEYYDQWADRMEDYLNGFNEDLWRCIMSGDYLSERLEQIGTTSFSTDVGVKADKQ